MHRLLIAALLALVLSSCKAVAPEALPAAQAWLALVDSGQYADSWTQAAPFFKEHVASAAWEAQVGGVRRPLGKVQSRTVKSQVATKKLPNAPDGEYVVFIFETSFEHKPQAIETVTPMLAPDGQWRVSGYYVQ
jgi:hypothetical protein